MKTRYINVALCYCITRDNEVWSIHGSNDLVQDNEPVLAPTLKGTHVYKADIVQNLRKKLKAKQPVSVENKVRASSINMIGQSCGHKC